MEKGLVVQQKPSAYDVVGRTSTRLQECWISRADLLGQNGTVEWLVSMDMP